MGGVVQGSRQLSGPRVTSYSCSNNLTSFSPKVLINILTRIIFSLCTHQEELSILEAVAQKSETVFELTEVL